MIQMTGFYWHLSFLIIDLAFKKHRITALVKGYISCDPFFFLVLKLLFLFPAVVQTLGKGEERHKI